MPRIIPPGGAVDWPDTEGVLGVVGVAPWATLEFGRILYESVRAFKDWHFPRVLFDVNTKIPSRGRHLQLGEADPSPAIAATIEELAGLGATVAVVVCNTAHILFENWGRGAAIPVLNIIDETVKAAARRGARKVTPLTAESLAQADLYGRGLESAALACARLERRDQDMANSMIAAIKLTGRLSPGLERDFQGLLARLSSQRVDTLIAGCTELSIVGEMCVAGGFGFIDSNAALARAALRHMGFDDLTPEAALGVAGDR